ncbi:MAG: GreA/GreB family elongation factor [Elusimicrobia bacterium]|nr:GreA/GreB family elongation factor [Elusimicrobiota bacterium]
MSRAFIKEDAGDPDELPERPVPSSPNYVTPYGLDALRRKALELKSALAGAGAEERRRRELARDLRYVEARIARAILVDSKARPGDSVRFGARVRVRDARGAESTFAIVGQDEAEEGGEKVAWDSPAALALIGASVGNTVELPEGEAARAATVIAIGYQ